MPLRLYCFIFLSAGFFSSSLSAGVIRTYYIAAEDVLWDYAPSYPNNPMHNGAFSDDEAVFVKSDNQQRIGRLYHKARYIEYTDASFTQIKTRTPEWEHLGILGPVIRANVGDSIKVIFKNKTSAMRTSIHPHGVFYKKNSEGTLYDDGSAQVDKLDDVVAPGATYTYLWDVPERAGPGSRDPSSIVWLYHSHVNEIADTNAGLIGPIIISRQNALKSNGKLKGVDREFVVLFTVFDENKSPYLDQNIKAFLPDKEKFSADESFKESNLKHAMNGYIFDNIKGLTMRVGENIRWYQIALGTEVDVHTPHWHGNTVLFDGHRMDVLNLLPATHITVDMKPDNTGTWMYHCHVNDHIEAGMMGRYTVLPRR